MQSKNASYLPTEKSQHSVRHEASAGRRRALLPSFQTTAAASFQNASSALHIHIHVGPFLLSCSSVRASNHSYCLRRGWAPSLASPVRTRPTRLALGTGMIPRAASLIHTTVSPDVRGRFIFDSCSVLHRKNTLTATSQSLIDVEAGVEATVLSAIATRAVVRKRESDITEKRPPTGQMLYASTEIAFVVRCSRNGWQGKAPKCSPWFYEK